jgi:hypothetical protein
VQISSPPLAELLVAASPPLPLVAATDWLLDAEAWLTLPAVGEAPAPDSGSVASPW